MSDLISRQAALDCVTYDVEYTVERIEALPSAEPEIIKCKECKYADPFGNCDYVNFWNAVTDFCSRAERKENG